MEKITKSDGVNESERYLSTISGRTFLSLWSYPNPYKQVGTELADLIAVHGRDILLFSDKDIGWSTSSDMKVSWGRWFKRAVKQGANSVHGAARWIREHPQRVYLDAANKQRLPIDLSKISDPRLHLICVCSGVEQVIKRHYQDDSGTFMLSSHIIGDDHTTTAGEKGNPYFTIGDVIPDKEFVHVFSRSGLECVMREFDTMADFTRYLNWRAEGFRSKRIVFASGEEDLVAAYWGRLKHAGWDLSKVNASSGPDVGLTVVGGLYREMSLSPSYLSWRMECEESKLWDKLIEEFSTHAISGEVPIVAGHLPSFATSEAVLRFMASEDREQRIILSQSFRGMMQKSVDDEADRFVRKFPLRSADDTYGYVFMVSTFHPDIHETYENYRDERAHVVGAYCLDMLHQIPQLLHVVGIALDTSPQVSGRRGSSADVMLVERPIFDDDLLQYLSEARDELEITPLDTTELFKNIKLMDRFQRPILKSLRKSKRRSFRP